MTQAILGVQEYLRDYWQFLGHFLRIRQIWRVFEAGLKVRTNLTPNHPDMVGIWASLYREYSGVAA